MVWLWKLFLAWSRLSPTAVCEMSKGSWDFHDYADAADEFKMPIHGYDYTCERCGKRFEI